MPSEHELERQVWLDENAEMEAANGADDEYARNEAEYQAWLKRQWAGVEGYDEPDPAYDPRDPFDRHDNRRRVSDGLSG